MSNIAFINWSYGWYFLYHHYSPFYSCSVSLKIVFIGVGAPVVVVVVVIINIIDVIMKIVSNIIFDFFMIIEFFL